MQQTDGQLVERVVSAIHGHLSRRNIMQYLDNPEDCEGIARVCIEALSNSTQADAGLRDKVQFAISAWAWAQDIDGAVRNDLFERIDTALTGAPANSSGDAEQADERHCFGGMTKREVYLAGYRDAGGVDQGVLRALRALVEWWQKVDRDAECEYLNGHGWDDLEAIVSTAMGFAALPTPSQGAAKP